MNATRPGGPPRAKSLARTLVPAFAALLALACCPPAAAAGGHHARAGAPTFHNDARTPAADPFVLWDRDSGYYYAYSTEGADSGYHFAVYRSPDLGTWEKIPGGALPAASQWGHDWFWAPEVYHNERTGKYFLFYAARMNSRVAENFVYPDFEEPCKIGVAVADSPAGPFHNIANEPIDYFPYDPDYHDVNLLMDEEQKKPPGSLTEGRKAPRGTYIPTIDPNVFFDDGNVYLYFSRNAYRNWVWDRDLGKYVEESNIYAVRLDSAWWNDPGGKTMPHVSPEYVNANKRGDTGPRRRDGYTPVLDYGSDKQSWENAHVDDYENSGGEKKDRRWEEGSTTVKRVVDGKPVYYLTYSANNYENAYYGVGYATAEHPLGPWHKSATNPILSQNEKLGMYSTGHGSVIASPDGSRRYYVHHARPSTTAGRSLYTERTGLDRSGRLTIAQRTADTALPPGVGPLALSARPGVAASGRRISWRVHSAPGGRFDLANPQNRVRTETLGPFPARLHRDADGATVTLPGNAGDAAPVAGLRMTYQRERAAGGYFDVRQRGAPLSRTVPVAACTRAVHGTHSGPLTVRSGVLCASDATLRGPVTVGAGAALVSTGSRIAGPVTADRGSAVWLSGNRITGPVTMRGNRWLVFSGNTVRGPVSCAGNGSPTDLGSPNRATGPVTGRCTALLQ